MRTTKLAASRDAAVLVPLLRDTEEGDARIMAALSDDGNTAYVAVDGAMQVGAVVVRWAGDASEIVYIATVAELRGQGYGKAIIVSIFDEARQRRVRAIRVGTANSSLSNIAFYQKCGFRIDSVRRDFFDYLPSPIYEDGIQMRDMLVLRADLDE